MGAGMAILAVSASAATSATSANLSAVFAVGAMTRSAPVPHTRLETATIRKEMAIFWSALDLGQISKALLKITI
jgi:hypothetical protein